MKKVPMGSSLRLQNEGHLEFLFLGTGSAFVKENFQNNLLVIKGQDHLLIDCGTRCPEAFYKYKSSILQVRNIFISHSHSDHAGGVEELALMHRYATKIRPGIVITDEYKDFLWNMSLRGGLSYGEYGHSRYGESEDGFLTFDDYFTQIKPARIDGAPRPLYEANVGSINVKIFRTMHMPDNVPSWRESALSFGVLIDNRVLFPSDCRFDKDLLTWIESDFHPEWIFHDCQAVMGGVHASIVELKTLSADIKRKMFLCHYADSFIDFDVCGEGFAGLARPAVYYDFDMP